MKKNLILKLASVFTVISLLAALFVPATAVSETCDCGEYPMVIVCGMGNYDFYKNAGTVTQEKVFPPNPDAISSVVTKAIPAILLSDATNNWDITRAAVLPDVFDLFEGFSCNTDGTSKYKVTTRTFPKSMDNYPDAYGYYNENGLVRAAADIVGGDHTYCYNYDWRMSPLDNARDLKELIDTAKSDTGHSKVSLTACSFGGVITMAYLYLYGAKDINSCVLLSTTFSGVDFVGDIVNERVTIRESDLFNFLVQEGADTETKKTILRTICDALSKIGGTKEANRLIDEAFRFLVEDAYDEVIIPTFGYMPGIWSLVPGEDYESGKELMLDKADDSFIDLIDEYHYNVYLKRDTILKNAQADGMKLYIFSHYNKVGYPVYEACEENTDGLLETCCTSGGATVANYGTTLPEDYKAVNPVCTEHNHMSSDRVVDASTAMFPEQVWFVKDYRHVGCRYGANFTDYVIELMRSDKQLTVWSDKRYPQYLEVNADENIVSALTYSYTKGNVNLDEGISTDDARLALRYSIGLETKLNSTQIELGDVNDDGFVTTDDARSILRAAIGLDTL